MLRARQDWRDELDDMQRQMERFLQHFSSCKRQPVMFSAGVWQPTVDVYETPDEVIIVAELAGVVREDVRIVLHNNMLLLTGERRDARAGKPRVYQIMEVSFGRFERAIELPAAVTAEGSSARLDHGFLIIVMPKAAQPTARHVPIKIGKETGEGQEQP